MRYARLGLLLLVYMLSCSVWAQQTPSTGTQPPSAPTQESISETPSATVTNDPQAVSMVNQVLSVAGGPVAIMAITDYKATGNITYRMGADPDIQGSITIRGGGLGQLRMDSVLSTGSRSVVMNGLITEKTEDGTIKTFQPQAPMLPSRLFIPYLPLGAIVNGHGYSLSSKGLVEIEGRSLQDVQVQLVLPGSVDPNSAFRRATTMDFFIDPSNLQVVVMQDVVNNLLVRKVRYSDYRIANGFLVPFAISEEVDGQPKSLIQLTQIQFSTGLQDSDFQL
jgi:hypothetical protein